MTTGNDVRIVVDAENKTAAAFGSAAKGAKTVGDAADIAGRQLKDMGAKLEDANLKARRLAEAEERTRDKTAQLVERMVALKKTIADSGDESGKLAVKLQRLEMETRHTANANDDYRRSANRAAEEAREQARAYDRVAGNAREAARAVALLGAAAKLSSPGDAKNSWLNNLLGIGGDAGYSSIGGLGAVGQGLAGTPILGPAVIGAGAVAAVPAASFVGGAIGGAISAGGGAAAAAGGLAGAWMGDPDKFDAMWSASIDHVKSRWIESSAAFGDELEGALQVADRTLRDLPVEKILALSQSFVAPLAEGAGSGLTALADGFADSLERAQPAVDAVGAGLADIGHAGGDAFRMVSQGSEGGAHAIGDLTTAISFAIQATGLMVLGFENAYEKIRDFENANFDFISQVPVVGSAVDSVKDKLFNIAETTLSAGKALHQAGDEAYSSSTGIGSWASAAAKAQAEAMGLNDALTETNNTMLAMANANIGVAQGWLDLKEELKDGAKTLDLTTQAGIDNQEAIAGQIGMLERQREQTIATSDGSAEAIARANAAYAEQVEAVRKAAYAAGFDKGEVDKLVASLGTVPGNVKSDVKVSGLATSLDQGISLGNALNRIDGRTYSASIRISGIADAARAAAISAGAHAAGGPTGPGLSKMGEEGVEYARLPTGTMTYPHANTMQMQTMAGWGGGGGQLLIGSDGSRLGDLLVEVLADAVKAKGGRPELLGIRIQGR